MTQFVSLHNHSQFSILQALPSPKELFTRAKELGQEAIAVSDYGTMGGVWDCMKASKETGVKYIPGCEFYFTDDRKNKSEKLRQIVLLAKNAVGYKNLLQLHRSGFEFSSLIMKKVIPVIDWKLLEKYAEGLICLTACGNGIIGQLINGKRFDEAEEALVRLKKIFGDNLAAEVQANNSTNNTTNYRGQSNQIFTNAQVIKIANKYGVKIVGTSNTHYLNKEDADTHDIELAIGSGQPVFSGNRMKFNSSDLYLKSGDEVKAFFSRNYGEEFAEKICQNSKDLADLCEKSDWVDPKFSNPAGKELPTFPVKDQKDYKQFLSWLSDQNEEVKKLDEDKSYLRYMCEIAFKKMVPSGKEKEYRDRLELELDTFYFTGISSYMLIVADYVGWARKNGVSVGPGRGCLDGNTLVLTETGYKKLAEIKVGELVYGHSGKLRKVINTFQFDVNKSDSLIKIKSNYCYDNLILTPEHLLFVNNRQFKNKDYIYNNKYNKEYIVPGKIYSHSTEPYWKEAKNIDNNDSIFFPFITRKIDNEIKVIDLQKYNIHNKYELKNDIIEQIVFHRNNISCKQISKKTNINFEFIRKLKLNIKNQPNISDEDKYCRMKIIQEYLSTVGDLTINKWIQNNNKDIRKINRLVKLDNDFMYFLGRWIGDGNYHGNNRGISVVFNSADLEGIDRIYTYLTKLGFYVCKEIRKANNTLLTVSNSLFNSLLRELIPRYIGTPDTKHFPDFFRQLNSELLLCLINGLSDADGNISKKRPDSSSICTTSQELAFQVKELFTYLGRPSGILHNRNVKRYNIPTKDSYILNINNNSLKYSIPEGYSGKVTKTDTINGYDKVYDITVSEDNSYLTTSGIVHNSVAGSLVGYLLSIHQADPIKYGLIFERFYNKLKIASFSDIDMDFSQAGRQKVIQYITQKYGKENVAQISNVNKMTPKVFIKDLARSLQMGGTRDSAVLMGNTIADYISKDISSIEEAFSKCALFAESTKRNPDFIKHKKICNKPRAMSQHAAGLIIGTRPLSDIIPVRADKDGAPVVELDKDKAEDFGLVKMDLLGLETLDIIDLTYELIKEQGKEVPKIDIEAYDEKTYNLIGKGDTLCVFQFGTSAGTVELCRRIKPKNIEDLAIITTIARPASKDIRESLINVKNGKNKAKVMHPSLERAMKDTYGFSIYDESLLILAKDVAGWDLAEADKLRKLTKEKGKNPEKAKKWRDEFIEGAIKNKIEEKMAVRIWDEIILPFGSYSFNKSHAITYSFISYMTAYLKANYPLEFLLANLKSELQSNAPNAAEMALKIKNELRKLGKNLLPPDVNKSEISYKIIDDNTLITGMEAAKFLGEDAMEEILSKRPFSSFEDFMLRLDPKKARMTSIQALAAVGALDSFNIPRKLIYLYASDYRKKLGVWLKKHDPKQEKFEYAWPSITEWGKPELYALEQKYLGEAFICGKKEAYSNGKFFNGQSMPLKSVKKLQDKSPLPTIKGEIKSMFEFKIKKETSKMVGQEMMKLIIEDEFGDQISTTIFPDSLGRAKQRIRSCYGTKHQLEAGVSIHFNGSVNLYEDDVGIILRDLFDACPPPPVPTDLKAKKIVVKRVKKEKTAIKKIEEIDDIIGDLEDDLFDGGHIDLDEEEETWDI